MSEQYLEERVQRFLDSEVLKGDKEKSLYLRLYGRLRPFKQKKIFSDILAFQFFERDCKEDYDSLGFGGLSDVVKQSQIIEEFYAMCKEDETWRITLKEIITDTKFQLCCQTQSNQYLLESRRKCRGF